ncbi:hypothetical protein HQ590_11750 [bacterium]|nr:hypothetical protein [bacterium]
MLHARRFIVGSLLAAALPFSAQAIDVYTEPVGFISLEVDGTGGVISNQFSFLGLGMTAITAARGVISSAAGTVLTDSGSTWVDDAFNNANGAHYIELTAGTGAGVTDDIIDTSGSGHSVTTAADLSPLVVPGTTTYRIRRHWTLAGLFGATNDTGLLSGNSAPESDLVVVFDPVAQAYASYYYRTNAGWRTSIDAFTDVSTNRLYLDRGLIVKRQIPSSVTIKLSGAVKLGPTSIPVESGTNFIGNVYPTTNLTLVASGLYTGDSNTGVAPGTSAAGADTVLIWNGTGYDTYYYRTGAGWRSAADAFTDRGDTPLPIGGSIVVKRKGAGGAFDWVLEQPFTTP